MRGLATVEGNFRVSENFSIFVSGLATVEGNFGVRGNVVVVLFFLARYSLFVRGLVTSESCAMLAAESVQLTTRQLLLPGSLGSVFVSSHHELVCAIVFFGGIAGARGVGVLLCGQRQRFFFFLVAVRWWFEFKLKYVS